MDKLQRPDWLPADEWPWPLQAVPTPAGRIAVTDTGSGPTLLLTHVGSWGFIWREMIVDLSRDFRCVVFDSPGSGMSERVGWRDMTLTRAAEAVKALVFALDLDRFTLVAHDLGGPVGLAAAGDVSERVAGIVVVNSFGWRPSGRAFTGMLGLMGSGAMRELDSGTGMLRAITSRGFGAGHSWSSAERHIFRRGLDRAAIRTWHSYFADAGRNSNLYVEVDAALAGPLAAKPLLTVFGERNDPFGFQPRWRALFPDCVQRVIPKGGHFPMGDDPHRVATWIREWHGAKVVEPRLAAGGA
jgi:pimeloyl-ACP methyl ester carboxylesterase